MSNFVFESVIRWYSSVVRSFAEYPIPFIKSKVLLDFIWSAAVSGKYWSNDCNNDTSPIDESVGDLTTLGLGLTKEKKLLEYL